VTEAPVAREPAPDQGFDIPADLDVPSFLRDG
jgi:hypothetical protein